VHHLYIHDQTTSKAGWLNNKYKCTVVGNCGQNCGQLANAAAYAAFNCICSSACQVDVAYKVVKTVVYQNR